MGSAAKTKHGKVYRAPVDQARKQERQRIIKKNKKERQQVRLAIAKHTEVDDCIRKMIALERQILGLDDAPFALDVLKKKQKTIMDIIDKRKAILQSVKDEAELKELDDKMKVYNSEINVIKRLAEQEMVARALDPTAIPLPEGEVKDGEDRAVQLMGPKAAMERKDKEKLRRIPRGKRRAPGPPVGIPPDFSDSETEDQGDQGAMDFDETNLDPVPIPEELVRGGGGGGPGPGPSYAPIPRPGFPMPLRHAPGPPPPIPMPPPMFPHGNVPMRPEVAVISGAPQIRPRPVAQPKSAEPTTVQAAPQLRDLRSEAVKLIPTVLKRKTVAPVAPKINRARPAVEQAKSTDDAYNDFMKELSDLL